MMNQANGRTSKIFAAAVTLNSTGMIQSLQQCRFVESQEKSTQLQKVCGQVGYMWIKTEDVTPVELSSSKYVYVSGISTGDYEIKKKISKSDLTIETKTALIHEHMFDRLNIFNYTYENDGTKGNRQINPITIEQKRPEYKKQKVRDARF